MKRAHAIIAEGTSIVGIVRGDDDVEFRGQMFGELSARNVHVTTSATVNGQLVGLQVTVEGKATGRIRAQSLRLAQTASVDADTRYGDLRIEQGAVITGRFAPLAAELDAREFEYFAPDAVRPQDDDRAV